MFTRIDIPPELELKVNCFHIIVLESSQSLESLGKLLNNFVDSWIIFRLPWLRILGMGLSYMNCYTRED